jgi:hypothetical protein
MNQTCSWCSAPLPEKPVEVQSLMLTRGGARVVIATFCSTLCRDKLDSMIEGCDEPETEEDGDE